MKIQRRVKVVVPAFNAAKTMARTLDSILNQTHDAVSVIVVDDCSVDETPTILRDYANKVSVLRTPTNSGVSAARNLALDHGDADAVIAYCDADDWWDPTHLQESLACLQAQDADMVYSTPAWVNDNHDPVFPNWEVHTDFDPDKLKSNNYIWTSTVLHKPRLGYFDSALDSLEDWDMWLQALRKGWKIVQKQSRTAHYLVQAGTLASQSSKVRAKFMEKNGDLVHKELKLNLGCGDEVLQGWVNIDAYNDKADVKADVKALPYATDSVDLMLASHVLEHFTFQNGFNVLKEWYRALKPGGKVIIETPDLLATCDEFVKADEQWRIRLYGHFFAWPDLSPGQVHYFLYTETQLRWTLEQCGFRNIARIWPDSTYSRSLPGKERLFLRMEATK
jgi:teichuronic acid biosynthesis glycosyltransferase TuaG